MSNTSNRWKSQGGINRRAANNILNNNKQSTNTLTIPQQLGISNTTLEQYGDKRDMENGSLYKMTEGEQSYNTIIAYYPFNNLGESGSQLSSDDIVLNKTLNTNLTDVNKQGNFDLSPNYLTYNGSEQQRDVYPYIVEVPTYSQNAIQFRIPTNVQGIHQDPTCLISKESLNTLNAFSQTENTESISSILTFETFLFIPSGTENFCIFALDDLGQHGLYQTENEILDGNYSSDCFYLWYKGGENGNQLQTYYYYDNNDNITTITNNNCGEIVPDTWHKMTMVFGGSYIALYIDGKQTFQNPVPNGSYIPDKPIAFNLGPLTETFSDSTDGVTNIGTTSVTSVTTAYNYLITPIGGGPMLLDAKISLKANTKEFIEHMYNPGNGHQYATSRVPNSDEKYLSYLLSNEMIGFNAQVTCENDVAIAGKLTSYGETNIYAPSTFHDITRFYGDVEFNSDTTIVWNSEAINHLEILSAQDSTNTSILVQNDYNNNNMPSMLVYNTENSINDISETENLIFSISGENVSIGEIYGQNTFDVKGNSSFLGNVGIGKANPESTLDVDGSVSISGVTKIDNSLNVANNITSQCSIILEQSSSNITIGDSIGQIQISNHNGSYFDSINSSISFRTVDTTNVPTTRLFIDATNGNVGIGTNNITPLYTLDVSGTLRVSAETTLDSSLNVQGVATFQDITYGKTPGIDASGQEFPTCEWINDYIQKDGGWITEGVDNNINGIYNSNIDKKNGYVGI